MMLQQSSRIICAALSLALAAFAASAQTNLSAKANSFQPPSADGPNGESDRSRDGLAGPVRRVRTEVVKLSNVSGKSVEDSKRTLLETAEYDLKGAKTQNQYFPVNGAALTGREVYKYDEKGNISEMTLMSPDGALISKEVYKYDFDSVGNWVKMTTSVAVVENGKISFEPSEVTYRTIFYYLDAAMTKMLQPPASSAPSPAANAAPSPAAVTTNTAKPPATNPVNDSKAVNGIPAKASLDKLSNGSVQPINMDMRALDNDKNRTVSVEGSEPPPAPRPLLKPVSGGVLNGKALALPPPIYPEVARRMRTFGKVEVDVIVDENGKVISATAISGPSLLRDVAVEAALKARFSPTKLSGQPVKIAGRINYNFTLP
jgi:TonB family protein